ncbi:hypothetical protein RDWZM_005034 [Blomia tropicalis]|uniref:Glycosyltransferase family 92 protein n=1 Tax=Blomia tropicalis TaxID=40697 RepID=A0A9Q0M7A0_BLOTA|nr:hypothetical protein RDWZM_005034 [Blomia tropicalis]
MSKTSGLTILGNISLRLPERIQLDDTQTMNLTESESNLPAMYFNRWKQRDFGENAFKYKNVNYCPNVKMISPHRIRQNNLFWQIVQTDEPEMIVYAYNAYYDNRLYGKPVVKIMTVTDRQVPVQKRKWWCLLWFDNLLDPVLSTVEEVYTIWPEYWNFGLRDGLYGAEIFTCSIPKQYSNQIPQVISLQTTDNCRKIGYNPGNVLRVIYNLPKKRFKKQSIGICVQAFRFSTYDVSVRLVEWLEMVKILGADQVYFYVYGATENMMKVLRHYKKEGFVNWRQLTLPGEQVNVPSLYNYYYNKLREDFWPQELIELNDCLYRNIYRHKYLIVKDIDEMIIPQNLNNWHELIDKIENNMNENDLRTKAYYMNRHAHVYDMFEEETIEDEKLKPIPEYLYMMRHTYRSKLSEIGRNIKCFHRTDLVTAVHNHFPMKCINTTGHHSCGGLEININDSILMHYRRNLFMPKDCITSGNPINCTIRDRRAWRHFRKLYEQVQTNLEKIFGPETS